MHGHLVDGYDRDRHFRAVLTMIGVGLSLWGNAGSRAGVSPAAVSGLLFWADPSNLGTLFTDTAGTTPVTADGQYVARINNAAGGSLFASQATANFRLKYRTSSGLHWLEVDTTDGSVLDAYTLSAAISLTDNMTIYHSGLRSAAAGNNIGIGDTPTEARYSAWWTTDNKIYAGLPTGLITGAADTGTGGFLLTTRRSNTGPTLTVRKNAAEYLNTSTGVGATAGSMQYLFRVSGTYHSINNRVYGLAVYSSAHANGSTELAQLETYFGGKAGLTI